MAVYESAGVYITSLTTTAERVAAIEAIIDQLLVASLDAAGVAKFEEYTLNDGQTQIRARYKDVSAITAQITALERLKHNYLNQLNGRSFRLVDSKNFPGCR